MSDQRRTEPTPSTDVSTAPTKPGRSRAARDQPRDDQEDHRRHEDKRPEDVEPQRHAGQPQPVAGRMRLHTGRQREWQQHDSDEGPSGRHLGQSDERRREDEAQRKADAKGRIEQTNLSFDDLESLVESPNADKALRTLVSDSAGVRISARTRGVTSTVRF